MVMLSSLKNSTEEYWAGDDSCTTAHRAYAVGMGFGNVICGIAPLFQLVLHQSLGLNMKADLIDTNIFRVMLFLTSQDVAIPLGF